MIVIYFYYFNSSKNKWVLQDGKIGGVSTDDHAFDISDDFKTIAYRRQRYHTGEWNGGVFVKKLEDGFWNQFQDEIIGGNTPFEFGYNLVLSEDGKRLALYCRTCYNETSSTGMTYVYEIVDQ